MAQSSKRLGHLIKVQRQLKAMHEMRHATHLADARAAAGRAAEVLEGRSGEASMSDLFPDVYARFVERCRAEQAAAEAKAAEAAADVARETVRGEKLAQHHRDAVRAEERVAEDRAALETVEHLLAKRG